MKFLQARLSGAERGAASQRAVIVVGAVIVIALAVWLFYPRPVTDTVPETGGIGPGAETTGEERGDSARELIAELQAAGSPDYDAALERGQAFEEQGRLADAQLLYFFAARAGHSQAAYELGEMYDPTSFSAETSLMEEPDAFQAYKWYTQAYEGGVEAAEPRLAELREWTERESEAGNIEAEQLLLQWD